MHAMPLNFHTLQRIFFAIGCIALAVSCVMTYKFGATMSLAHAIGLVGVTICAAFIFPAKKFVEDLGSPKAAKWIGRVGIFFICVELFSHMGYTIGMREKSAQESGVQTAAYELRQEAVKSEVANIGMWRQQLADLKARNSKHLEKNQGWLVSVDPTAMQEAMAALDQKIENEANRKYCGSKCEKLKEQKAQLAALIANVKEENDLTARIEATQRLIDQKSEVAATADKGFSAAKAQTGFLSQIVLLAQGEEAEKALTPDNVTVTVMGIVIGFVIALAGTFLPTTAFYLAFFGQAHGVATRAMTEVQANIEEVYETAKGTGRDLVASAADKGRDIIRETVKIDDGLRASIQRRLDDINARPRRRFA
jgi:hypothetical protein